MSQSDANSRAPRTKIFDHLNNLLGVEGVQIAKQVAQHAIDGEREESLKLLQAYDAKLGGVSLHWFEEKRQLGVYRSLFYVLLPLKYSNAPQHDSRRIIYSSGVYLEELIKRMVRLNIFDKLRDTNNKLPLGVLVRKVKKYVPVDIANELEWLSQRVHNYAKHAYNFELEPDPPEHYFDLDEAIAVYLIARKLGLELESISGKTHEQLMME
ncbi:MAG: hypothetical protein DRI56_07530 [Chloroflexota bacterium]|nr:MAG: hypothetical protein DRI56_07530 [Chloroflexota bacterium]